MKRSMTQQEIDAVFGGKQKTSHSAADVDTFDVRRLDTIPRSQLQSLHLLHENFARNLASSLSAYLRSSVILNLVSLERLSYGDFVEGLSSPACLTYISMLPYDGTAVLDINTNLVFTLLELLLGSKDHSSVSYQRKITDIEKKLMHTLLRVMLHDLHDSWRSVAEINFAVQSLVSEPQLTQSLTPSEAMIVIAIEVRLGSVSGLMNLAIPSVFIKRLRSNFDQLQQARKLDPKESDQLHIAQLLWEMTVGVEVCLSGGEILADTLTHLKVGDILMLDHPANGVFTALLNGKDMWLGQVAARNGKLVFQADTSIFENSK